MISTVKKNKVKETSGWGGMTVRDRVVRKGIYQQVAFEQRSE